MNKIYKKWWFWLIVIIVVMAIAGSQGRRSDNSSTSPYITKYEWNLDDTKSSRIEDDRQGYLYYKYVVLGVENKDGDLQAGDYVVKTNSNEKASFQVLVTSQYYENEYDIPYAENIQGMVQGWDGSTLDVSLQKGQYIYLVQSSNGEGKVYLEKK